MAAESGAVGGLVNVGTAENNFDFDAFVSVSGQVVSQFDAELGVSRTAIGGEFDAKLCVAQEALPPSAIILSPSIPVTSGFADFNVAFSGLGVASPFSSPITHLMPPSSDA